MKYKLPIRIEKDREEPTRNIVDADGKIIAFNVEKEIANIMVEATNRVNRA